MLERSPNTEVGSRRTEDMGSFWLEI